MTTIHVGRHRVQTTLGSDGSPIPLGTLAAPSDNPAIATSTVDPATNNVTITGVASGDTMIRYSAPGYNSAVQNVTVSPLPSIVVTDGPEV